MAELPITSVYGGLLALLFLMLSVRVILYRRSNKLSVGDQGDRALLKRMRVQANCAEYAPFGVVLLLLCEMQNAPALALHVLGIALLVGRISHAWGMSVTPQDYRFRTLGMVLTISMFALAATGLILHGLL